MCCEHSRSQDLLEVFTNHDGLWLKCVEFLIFWHSILFRAHSGCRVPYWTNVDLRPFFFFEIDFYRVPCVGENGPLVDFMPQKLASWQPGLSLAAQGRSDTAGSDDQPRRRLSRSQYGLIFTILILRSSGRFLFAFCGIKQRVARVSSPSEGWHRWTLWFCAATIKAALRWTKV